MVVGSNRGGIQPLSLEKGVLILKLSIYSDREKGIPKDVPQRQLLPA
jgi:hypothetical protein